MSGAQVFRTASEDETARVAGRLAASLPPGSVVLLFGDLGAGKTAFVRGMAAGLGLDPDEVSSPTFTLVQEYRGAGATPALYHVDLYRLEGGEAEDLGLEELSLAGGVVAIEWAEKLLRPIPGATRVEILDLGEDRREIRIARPQTEAPPR
jgi:tRNA threonylcarbamoyladenosine biosynthesis protein TsaE